MGFSLVEVRNIVFAAKGHVHSIVELCDNLFHSSILQICQAKSGSANYLA
jgi:hypothetical protein